MKHYDFYKDVPSEVAEAQYKHLVIMLKLRALFFVALLVMGPAFECSVRGMGIARRRFPLFKAEDLTSARFVQFQSTFSLRLKGIASYSFEAQLDTSIDKKRSSSHAPLFPPPSHFTPLSLLVQQQSY